MRQKTLRAVMFGPPGSGKGTQGRFLAQKFHVPFIGSGDLFRSEIEQQTELGKLARVYVDSGCLAPDDLVNGIVSRQMKSLNLKHGFVLDGYPRTVDQAAFFQRLMPVNVAILIKVSDEIALNRLKKRRKKEKRSDDLAETIRTRIRSYHFLTEPLAQFYRQKGVLLMIKGDQSVEYVHEVLVKKLAKLGFVP